jgi:hypothetical protein
MKPQKISINLLLLLSLSILPSQPTLHARHFVAKELIPTEKKRNNENGKVFLTLKQPKNAKYKAIYTNLKSKRPMDAIIKEFNETLNLPNNIQVIFDECKEENAFYDTETQKITICYELISKYVASIDQNISLTEKIQQATAFTLFHELGHALVDQLDLPITGKEENAVDEFAMIMLLDSENEKAIDLVVEGVLQFYYDSLDEESIDFTDVHAPSKERYFDLLTLYIGVHDIKDMKTWIGKDDDQLPVERAEGASDEYEKKRDSWDKLLAEHFKN